MEGTAAWAATGLEHRGSLTAGGSIPLLSFSSDMGAVSRRATMARVLRFDSECRHVAEVKLVEAPGRDPGEVGSSPTGHLWGVTVSG